MFNGAVLSDKGVERLIYVALGGCVWGLKMRLLRSLLFPRNDALRSGGLGG